MSTLTLLVLVGAICTAVGAVAGALWGRKHPSAATRLAVLANEVKAKL